jgi:hypothetical protein
MVRSTRTWWTSGSGPPGISKYEESRTVPPLDPLDPLDPLPRRRRRRRTVTFGGVPRQFAGGRPAR